MISPNHLIFQLASIIHFPFRDHEDIKMNKNKTEFRGGSFQNNDCKYDLHDTRVHIICLYLIVVGDIRQDFCP